MPVIVTVKVPVVARPPTVNVNVLVDVPGFGLKAADKPLCKPETENVTPVLKPFEGVITTVRVPFVPRPRLKLVGDAESAKFGAAVTVRETVVEAVKLAQVPVIVTVTVPVAAVALAVNARPLAPVAPAGLKDAVTPFGRPEAERLTAPLNPLNGLTVMVLAPWFPCAMLSALGDAESV